MHYLSFVIYYFFVFNISEVIVFRKAFRDVCVAFVQLCVEILSLWQNGYVSHSSGKIIWLVEPLFGQKLQFGDSLMFALFV